jgi:hypothetical protein
MLVLVAGFSMASANVSQVYAYHPHHGWGGGYGWCGYGWGGGYSFYYPYYNGCYGLGYGIGYGGYGYSYPYSYYTQPTQYQLTVNVNPSSASTAVSGGGAYNQGSSATFTANQNIIQVSQNTRYVFSRWTGDYSGAGLSGAITMDAAKTVTAVYQLQYYLSVNTPSNVPSIQGAGWYNAGDPSTITVSSQIVGGSDSRLVFNGWSVDGNNGPTDSTLTVQMNAPHSVNAQYKQQYYLTVSTDQGTTSGTGWYDAGSYAQISTATPPSPFYGVNMVFNGWNGAVDSSSSQSTRVLMDGAKTVTGTWRADSTVLYVTIAAVAVAIALIVGSGSYLVTKRRKEVVTTTYASPNVGESKVKSTKVESET